MSSDPSGRKGQRRIAPSSVRVRALHPAPTSHRYPVHGFGPRHDARGYSMRDERFEVTVTFDERRGYVASAPKLRSPVTALSLGVALENAIDIAGRLPVLIDPIG